MSQIMLILIWWFLMESSVVEKRMGVGMTAERNGIRNEARNERRTVRGTVRGAIRGTDLTWSRKKTPKFGETENKRSGYMFCCSCPCVVVVFASTLLPYSNFSWDSLCTVPLVAD